MTRRLLLQAALGAVWIATAGARLLPARLRTARAPLPAAASSTGPPLTAAEVQTLVALAEAAADDRPLSPEWRHDLGREITESARDDADERTAYRTAAALVDRLAGRAFAGLDFGERVALIAGQQLHVSAVPAEAPPGDFSEERRAVRTRAVPALVAAYWRSPAGWAAVDYDAFPGRCGDLTRYTRRPG